MKKIEISLLIAVIITSLFFSEISVFAKGCDEISDKVLRLHITANSNSEDDQNLKLLVRDAVLQKADEIIFANKGKDEACDVISKNISLIKKTAKDVVLQNGYNYPISCEVGRRYFTTRTYDDITMPAGEYDALCIDIGSGEGKNWWCVCFPPMCLPGAVKKQELSAILTDEEIEFLESKPRYKAQFAIVELWNSIRNKLNL
ncbi:MAG: stage II sporulation protein R [Oscillospiraceae bacterium]|nr:stage II sporulation protein R [Oscillospiraceae bacterium]